MSYNAAQLYDLIYEAAGKDYASESSAIRDLIRARNPSARRLLDVGCGTGGHLRHLVRTYDVVGVDLDASMLREARRAVPEGVFVEADMRTLDLVDRFDAVICLFSSVGYMGSTDELDRAVGAMVSHLNPGGVLVVDGWVRPDLWRDGTAPQVDVATRSEMTVVRVARSTRVGQRTHLEMHHLVATAVGIDHLVDHHDLTLFRPEDYEEAFRKAGVTADTVESPMEGRDRYVGVRMT